MSKNYVLEYPENVEEVIDENRRFYNEAKDKRGSVEENWFLNTAFQQGLQYVKWLSDQRTLTNNYAPTWKVRHVSNLCSPALRVMKSHILGSEPIVHVHPSKTDNESKESARIGDKWIQWVWYTENCFEKLLKAYDSVPTKADHYWKVFWDKSKGQTLTYPKSQIEPNDFPIIEDGIQKINEKNEPLFYKLDLNGNPEMESVKTGGVSISNVEVESLFVDPASTCDDDCRWKQHVYPMDVQEIEGVWGVPVNPEQELISTGFDAQLSSLLGINREYRYGRSAMVIERWERPSRRFPKGRVIVTCNGKLLQYIEIPKEYLQLRNPFPFIHYRMESVPGSYYSKTPFTDARGPQRTINIIISKMAEHVKLMASGKWIIADRNNVPDKYITSDIQVMRYKWAPGVKEPHQAQLAQMPGYPLELLGLVTQHFNDILGIHDVSHGRPPKGIRAGTALAALQEMDVSQLEPVIKAMKSSLSDLGKMLLSIAQVRCLIPQMLTIVGKDKEFYVEQFVGSMVDLESNVTCEQDTALPQNKVYREEMLKGRLQINAISIREYRKFMEIEDDEIDSRERIDEAKAKWENSQMDKGVQCEVVAYDYHPDHLREHYDRMKDPNYILNVPQEIKNLYQAHTTEHANQWSLGMMTPDSLMKLTKDGLQQPTPPQAQSFPGSEVVTSGKTMPRTQPL